MTASSFILPNTFQLRNSNAGNARVWPQIYRSFLKKCVARMVVNFPRSITTSPMSGRQRTRLLKGKSRSLLDINLTRLTIVTVWAYVKGDMFLKSL